MNENKIDKKEIKNPSKAPFNFVPLNKKILECDEKNDFLQFTGYSGWFDIFLTTKTPLAIGEKEDGYLYKFGRDLTIPGSSLRGVIRNISEIIGYSKFYENDDYKKMRYFYRDFNNESLYLNKFICKEEIDINEIKSNQYEKLVENEKNFLSKKNKNKIDVLSLKVKAGFLKKEGNNYFLIKDLYYARVDHNANFKGKQLKSFEPYSFEEIFFKKKNNIEFQKHKYKNGIKKDFPYYLKYDLVDISKNNNQKNFSRKGYLIISGKIPKKKTYAMGN